MAIHQKPTKPLSIEWPSKSNKKPHRLLISAQTGRAAWCDCEQFKFSNRDKKECGHTLECNSYLDVLSAPEPDPHAEYLPAMVEQGPHLYR